MSMKKPKFLTRIADLMRTALTIHPVELLVLIHATTAAIGSEFDCSGGWIHAAVYAPIATVAALCLAYHRGRRRWVTAAYWAVLPLYLLACLLPEEWNVKPAVYVILPAIYLLAQGVRSDLRYTQRFYSLLRSLLLSVGISLLFLTLMWIIIYSTQELFNIKGLWGDWALDISLYVSFILVAPLTFIGFESQRDEEEVNRVTQTVVNYILTPAMIIYHVILCIYGLTILINWELPQNSVASMVLSLVTAGVAIDIVRPLLPKQPLGWYFRWFGMLALPLVVLFWVAVGYRVGQYGMTPSRCYLVLAGLMATLYCVLRPWLRRRPWYWGTIMAVAGVLILAYGGPLSARNISVCHQLHLVRTNASEAQILSPSGKIDMEAFRPDAADSQYRMQHRNAYQAMKYIENDLKDTVILPTRLGINSADYLNHLSDSTAKYASAYIPDNGWYPDENFDNDMSYSIYNDIEHQDISIEGFEQMIVDQHCRLDKGIPYPGGEVPADTFLTTQLGKIGYTLQSNLDQDKLEKNKALLLEYTSADGAVRIVLDELVIKKKNGMNLITHAHVCYALSR